MSNLITIPGDAKGKTHRIVRSKISGMTSFTPRVHGWIPREMQDIVTAVVHAGGHDYHTTMPVGELVALLEGDAPQEGT